MSSPQFVDNGILNGAEMSSPQFVNQVGLGTFHGDGRQGIMRGPWGAPGLLVKEATEIAALRLPASILTRYAHQLGMFSRI